MKISILLPYKENFTPEYAGAVSLFLNDTIKLSKYKKNIQVFGNTSFKKKLLTNYTNLKFTKFFFRSSSKAYVKKFLVEEKLKKSNLIEIHNRPEYINSIYKKNKNIVLYFHNNPLEMKLAKTINERINLYDKTKKIILFVGRLNISKGYDIFGEAIINILNNYPDWNAIVIGDEPRERHVFKHRNLKILGFQKNNIVTKWFIKSDISIVCPRKSEPFGRTALEASSAGCALIITDKGGLREASPKAMKLKTLTVKNVEKSIKKLIKNDSFKKSLQKRIYKHFYLTNNYISKKIDRYRDKLI